MSPTQRSLKKLRDEGWLCQVVERWNQYAKVRQDLFGFIDILAIMGNNVLAVQCTTASNASARVTKIHTEPRYSIWNDSPHRMTVVHAWAKTGPRGGRKTWTCKEIWL